MGQQATVVILLDALDNIKNDKDFGRKLADAVLEKANHSPQGDRTITFNAHSGNAGSVIEVHHADHTVTVELKHNTGKIKPFKR